MIATLAAIALLTTLSVDRPVLPAVEIKPQPTPVVLTAGEPAPMLESVAVTLECTAFADGRIGDCAVLGETHPGMGFGAAAIALMRDVTTDPAPADHKFARTIQFMP